MNAFVKVRTHRKEQLWQRVTWCAVVLMLACAGFALAYQDSVQPPWYQRVVFRSTVHLAETLHTAHRWVTAWWPRVLRPEQLRIEQGLIVQQATLRAMEELRQQRDRLQAIVDLAPAQTKTVLAARVVLHNLRAPFKMLIIARGVHEGVTAGMIAVAQGGLVGRVERVTAHHAAVLLLTDPNHAVDVVTQRARVRGILVGRGSHSELQHDGGPTRMEFLLGRLDIEPGDAVVTSGLDGRYPSGIPVGTVHDVHRTADGIVSEVEVLPMIDWTVIEEVGLLATPPTLPRAVVPESTL